MLICPQSLKAPNLFGAILFECRLRHQVSKPVQTWATRQLQGDGEIALRSEGSVKSGGTAELEESHLFATLVSYSGFPRER